MGRKYLIPLLSACVLLVLGTVGAPAQASGPAATTYFFDGFNGTSISSLWNTTIETSGVRWCSFSPTSVDLGPGQWQDVSTDPCGGVTQSPPYGQVTEGGGVANFNATSEHAIPYIWAGPPSRPSPFPSTGDFVLQIRMAYTGFGGTGDGIRILSWPDSTPEGWNPPGLVLSPVFIIHGDTENASPYTVLAGQVKTGVPNPTAFHVYKLSYIGGQYTLYVDGSLWQGPVASPVRPTAIYIMGPGFFSGQPQWSTFSVDSIGVVVRS